MSTLTAILFGIGALLLALLLAYVPLRMVLGVMAKTIVGSVKAFIERRRERRAAGRETPDRRSRPADSTAAVTGEDPGTTPRP